MKILPLLLMSVSLFAANPTIYIAPPSNIPKESADGKQPTMDDKLTQKEVSAAAKAFSSKGSTEMMIISPEGRAKDIKAAIEFLKKHAPTTKPTIKMANGTTLSGIMDVQVMPGGTVLIFQIASLKGVQYQVENIENIDAIEANGT
jgi:hypothetical protein